MDRDRFDADPDRSFHFDVDPDRYQNDADPHANSTPSFIHVRKYEIFLLTFTAVLVPLVNPSRQRRKLIGVIIFNILDSTLK